jgi:transposase
VEKKFPEYLMKLQKKWIKKGDTFRLMFQDEARFGRISDHRRCWCPAPKRPICSALVSQENTYAYGVVSLPDGQFESLVLPRCDSDCMQVFLKEISSRHPKEKILMVMDGAGWHKAKSLKVPKNIRLCFLPPYSPELNPVEHIWDELKEKGFHNRVFSSLDALEDHLVNELHKLENAPEVTRSIASWPWIINRIFQIVTRINTLGRKGFVAFFKFTCMAKTLPRAV